MIQRKQTLFLLIAAIASAVAAFCNTGTVLMQVLLFVAAAISLADVFLFKNRPRQAFIALIPIVLWLVWYVLVAVENRNSAGGFVLTWSDALPAVAIVLVFFARQGIRADEKLVRSLDRIR